MKYFYKEGLETCPICGGNMRLTKFVHRVTGAQCEECKLRISMHRSIPDEYLLFSGENFAVETEKGK